MEAGTEDWEGAPLQAQTPLRGKHSQCLDRAPPQQGCTHPPGPSDCRMSCGSATDRGERSSAIPSSFAVAKPRSKMAARLHGRRTRWRLHKMAATSQPRPPSHEAWSRGTQRQTRVPEVPCFILRCAGGQGRS